MNTSSRISEAAVSAGAPAWPKALRWWLLAELAVIALGSSVWAGGPLVSFRPPQSVGGPADGVKIALTDLSGDGKLDVVVGTLNSSVVTYLGNGDGTFGQPIVTTVTAATGKPVEIAVGDLNGDGFPDVVTTTNENILRVFLGNGNGHFTTSSTYPTGPTPNGIGMGDFNRDGYMDVAVSVYGSALIRIFFGTANTVNGLFPTQSTVTTAAHPGGLVAADFNQDGHIDLGWTTDAGNSFLLDARPPGIVTFVPVTFGTKTGATAGILGGNSPSFVIAQANPNKFRVFSQPLQSSLESQFAAGEFPSGMEIADFNGDGKGDIAVANQGNPPNAIVQIYLGNGNGDFDSLQNFPVGYAPIGVAVGDLDGDAQPDVVVADLSSGFEVLLQRHRTQVVLNAPAVFASQQGVVTVAVSNPSGFVPVGNVTLSVDGGAALTAALVNGQASINVGMLAAGNHSLVASYAEQDAFASSTGNGTLTVNPLRATHVAITAPAVNVGQAGLVTVAISGVGTSDVPTGNVTLSVDGGAAVTAALVNGQATFNPGNLPYGDHSLAASYVAQGTFLASTGSGTLTVNRLPSVLALTPSASVYIGQPVSVPAYFGVGQGPGGTVPVQYYTDSSLSTPIPPPTNVGTYFATASFAGDATYAPTALGQNYTITQAATRITVSINATNPNTGSPVAATGSVVFVDSFFQIDVGTARFPPSFTYYLASDTGFANPLAGPPRDSGSYVVVASLAATANYQAATPQSAAFTIVGAASLVVTTTVDEDNGTSDPAFGTGTSLREALKYAQNLGGARTITFAPGLAGQTVTLNEGWGGSGDTSALAVSTAVTIQGLATSPGVTLAMGAGVTRRHFYVADGGALTLQNLTLTGGNPIDGGGSAGNGGSIESYGDLDVTGCTFTGNIANRGGALYLSSPIASYQTAQMRVANSTFTGNTTRTEGGAIYTSRAVMALTNVTIADNNSQLNNAQLRGGGIYQELNETQLVNCIIARNTPDDLVSLVSQVVDSYNNLIGVPAASLGLGALADHGGPTRTMALQPNSPALNAGATVAGLTTDQRGQGRPQFGAADIGAFELNAFDTGQATLSVGGAYWYLGLPASGNDLRVYYLLPGQPEVWVDNGVGVRIGQALDGTVLVENSSGEVYARTGSTTGLGTAWPRLTSVVAGDGATWFFGPDGLGSDAYIYRWASGGAPTYSFGFGTQLSVAPNGAIFARNNAGNDYLRVGSDAGLGSSWQIVNRSLVSWRLLHGLPYDGTQDLANPAADGVANLLKYAFNLAPNIGDLAQVNLGVLPANGTAGLPFITPDPQGHLFIEFIRRKAATNPGVTCIVETGDYLTALQPLDLSGATVASIDATWERVTVTDPVITPKRFGRVRVIVEP